MACMKLGSKADVFQLEGQSWLYTTGLPSDVCVQVEEMSFHLHKFPLLSRSKLLESYNQDKEEEEEEEEQDGTKSVWSLDELPGGAGSFLLVAKFCYDVKFELTATNIVSLRCAAEHLQMTDEYGEGNLIPQTCSFLDQVLNSWVDTIQALETCEAVLPLSEELDIFSRCIDSLAVKACKDRCWPLPGQRAPQSPSTPAVWNGIHSTSEPCSPAGDWWFDDVAVLNFPLFKRLIRAVSSQDMMMPNKISGAVMFYAKRYLPLHSSGCQNSHESANPSLSDGEQTTLVEEITELLPDQKGATPTKFLLKLLKIAILLDASPQCREILERRIGEQLDQANVQDLLIPNTVSSVETLYDVDCVQRLVDHFLDMIQDEECEVVDEERSVEGSESPPLMTTVANLLDGYLAEIASDVNLKLEDFVLLTSSFPDYARSLDDGIYRAIDVYLKAHPWLTEAERELLCRLMNFQKLSLDASTNAAQNEMLPLRVTMQLLFFEQLRLRSYMAGWFVVAGSLENASGNTPQGNERNSGGRSKRDSEQRGGED